MAVACGVGRVHCLTFGKYFGSRHREMNNVNTLTIPPVMSVPENQAKEGRKHVYQSVTSQECPDKSHRLSPITCPGVPCQLCISVCCDSPHSTPHTHWKAPHELTSLLFVSTTRSQGLPSLPQWTGQDLACSQCSANTYLLEEQHLRVQTVMI